MLTAARQYDEKYRILMLLGFHSGLRISDILKIRVRDTLKTPLILRETKTGKKRVIEMPQTLLDEIYAYSDRVLKNCKMNYLVYSRYWCKNKPLSRVQAYKVLRKIAESVGLDRTGTHCMRKSFAFDLFRETKDINIVRETLNHKYADTTMRYLLTPEMLEAIFT